MGHRIGRVLLACFLCGVCAAFDRAPRRSEGPVVKIDSGIVEGAHSPDNPELVFFRGIPYAAPPVGALRWKPPQLPARWHGARKADELSAACPQTDFVDKIRRRILRMWAATSRR
jgi:para-nitrobenzyl esterase